MRIYLRELDGSINDWWSNLGTHACEIVDGDVKGRYDTSDPYNRKAQEIIEESRGRLSPNFWERDSDEYVEFDDDEDAMLFMLRFL